MSTPNQHPPILPPTRLERYILSGAYVSTAAIGLSVLVESPHTLPIIGNVLTAIWACFMLTAIPCIPAAIRARYRIEYTFLPFFTAALLVSVIALWVHYGNGDIAYTLPRVLVATALVFMFSWRLASLHRIVRLTTGTEVRPWIRLPFLFKRSRH